MSHLNTATLGIDGGAINVPTSGVGGETDPRKIYERFIARGWIPLPFESRQQSIKAAVKAYNAVSLTDQLFRHQINLLRK